MKKKVTIALCVLLCLALLAGAGLWAYVAVQRNRMVLPEPQGHAANGALDATAEEMATLWIDSLMEPYAHFYVPKDSRVVQYSVQAVDVLEDGANPAIRVQFSFNAAAGESAAFDAWGLAFDGETYMAEWVVLFALAPNGEEGKTIAAQELMRPAAWDLAEYNASGQREMDELRSAYEADIPYITGENTYKIEEGTCYITFGGGSWVATPLPLDQLDYLTENGHFKTNELQAGSYAISREKTIFLYGGVTVPLACLYSDDGGESWSTAVVAGAPENVTRKYVSFPDETHGFIAVGHDKTMNWEACALFASEDGGASWRFLREGPGDHVILSMAFFNAQEGFLSYWSPAGIDLCRTQDGGVNWQVASLAIEEEYLPFFTRAGTPVWEGEALALYIGEDEMSDFSAGQDNYLRYVSPDGGESWVFDAVVRKTAYEPG